MKIVRSTGGASVQINRVHGRKTVQKKKKKEKRKKFSIFRKYL